MTDRARHEDLVFVLDLSTDEIYEFSTYVEQLDGSLLIGDYLESEQTFFRTDGERLSPMIGGNGTVERLRPTGERNPSELTAALERNATREGISWDGADPMDWLLAVRRREYTHRWPQWPKWLERCKRGLEPE
ncbi:hypothetical protein ACLM5J_04935 [Nocardioides sp. Bht2]|uniref:hypothetical protein n=1 Tax=Nocardioides sp. Bht2 TaxID=3392297 RepID=UPI0039B606F4